MLDADFTDIETRALRSRLAGDRVILAGLRLLLLLEHRANFDPAQPRDGQGRWTGTGWSSTARVGDPWAETPDAGADGRVRVAGPFDWGPVDLRDEEGYRGSHTLQKHVERSDEQLMALVAVASIGQNRAPPNGWRVGSFSSVAEANLLVDDAIAANKLDADAVRSGVLESVVIYQRLGRVTGREAVLLPGSQIVRIYETNSVKVLLIHDDSRARGYYVHSAYPVNLK